MLGKSHLSRATMLAIGARISAAFGGLPSAIDAAVAAMRKMPPRRRGRIVPTRGYLAGSRSKYMPHQGKRECARRRGGDDWANFKALDRVRRGLPVSWPYQGMEG